VSLHFVITNLGKNDKNPHWHQMSRRRNSDVEIEETNDVVEDDPRIEIEMELYDIGMNYGFSHKFVNIFMTAINWIMIYECVHCHWYVWIVYQISTGQRAFKIK